MGQVDTRDYWDVVVEQSIIAMARGFTVRPEEKIMIYSGIAPDDPNDVPTGELLAVIGIL